MNELVVYGPDNRLLPHDVQILFTSSNQETPHQTHLAIKDVKPFAWQWFSRVEHLYITMLLEKEFNVPFGLSGIEAMTRAINGWDCVTMEYDIIIKNGRVIDGTGNPWVQLDVGVSDGKITSVGELNTSQAARVIDATGLIVSPGFIDIHAHSDLTLLINANAESKVKQGMTTEVLGNCGTSPAPVNESTLELLKKTWGSEADEVDWSWKTFGDYLRRIENQGTAVNVIGLVGHGTVRIAVMGVDNRAPSNQELTEMKELVTSAMVEGAFGMPSGLVYLPGSFATTAELVELCKIVANHGGLYTSHIR